MSLRFKDYPTLLEEIRKRPQMYHGGDERSALLLSIFLGGFDVAELFHNIPETERLGGFDWDSYEKWIRESFNPERLSLNSFSLASHITSTQQEAFDLWYSWYDDFGRITSSKTL